MLVDRVVECFFSVIKGHHLIDYKSEKFSFVMIININM